MNGPEMLIRAIGNIDPVLIQAAEVMDRPRRRIDRRLALALIAAASLLAFSITAYAAGRRIYMEIQESRVDDSTYYEMSFLPGDNGYIDLGYWYPEKLPDGFEEVFVSDYYSYEGQTIWLKSKNGDTIRFEYAVAGDWNNSVETNVVKTENVTVNGNPGQLFTSEYDNNNASKTLYWYIEDRGIRFSLNFEGTANVDLLAIAESVTEQNEGRPISLTERKDEALEELGVYMPTALPEGYDLIETHASPTSNGGGWYGYVDFLFENNEHDTIRLFYDTVSWNGITPKSGVTVLGNTVSWYVEGAGPQKGLHFHLTSGDLTTSELQALAESIELQP